ncbi:hypothetical protein QEG98_04465 [Myxococcus sp. MxC21-1]|uniref:hypothetical protein n=1 Tax=Myxococcus sp. MxC21-1 TaxID=3041439 RepID=UPI00292CF582|nr:hypothetical protein [Myxococcus sp. MxC21-1]WNZ63055.1 hypothetical protein QEG98_04465 [Myxococcus sp. MxC21-1]
MTLATLILLATLSAQPPEAPPSSEATAPETVTAPPLVSTPDACAASSEADYSAGFDALVSGNDAKALELFERVLAACPQHPYATELARLSRTRLAPGGGWPLPPRARWGESLAPTPRVPLSSWCRRCTGSHKASSCAPSEIAAARVTPRCHCWAPERAPPARCCSPGAV